MCYIRMQVKVKACRTCTCIVYFLTSRCCQWDVSQSMYILPLFFSHCIKTVGHTQSILFKFGKKSPSFSHTALKQQDILKVFWSNLKKMLDITHSEVPNDHLLTRIADLYIMWIFGCRLFFQALNYTITDLSKIKKNQLFIHIVLITPKKLQE